MLEHFVVSIQLVVYLHAIVTGTIPAHKDESIDSVCIKLSRLLIEIYINRFAASVEVFLNPVIQNRFKCFLTFTLFIFIYI